jgi:ankyrin repeat protein
MDSILKLLHKGDALKEVKTFVNQYPTKINNKDYWFGDYGKDGKGTLLHFACLWNRSQAVSFLLSKNADRTITFEHFVCKNLLQVIVKGDYLELNGLTAKEIAVKKGYTQIVELFLDKKKQQFLLLRPISRKSKQPLKNYLL